MPSWIWLESKTLTSPTSSRLMTTFLHKWRPSIKSPWTLTRGREVRSFQTELCFACANSVAVSFQFTCSSASTWPWSISSSLCRPSKCWRTAITCSYPSMTSSSIRKSMPRSTPVEVRGSHLFPP